MKNYNVLFTGGIDSTYRLCQLASDKDATVQPIYILFPRDGHPHSRPEIENEVKSQDNILSYIVAQPQTKAVFKPIRRINRSEIFLDDKVAGLEPYLAEFKLGWQYLYFAELARWYPGIELCHEFFPNVSLENKLFFKESNGQKIIDTDKTDEIFSFLFKDFSWPIFGTTRMEMLEDFKKWGYYGILKHIWWCYQSIDGKPCGFCDNCRAKIKEGLSFLFDKEAIHRFLAFTYVKSHLDGYYWGYAFYEYFFNHEYICIESRDKNLLWSFKQFDRILKLKDSVLKKLIIEGSFDYAYSRKKKEQILAYKKDVNRKHMFDFLQTKFK